MNKLKQIAFLLSLPFIGFSQAPNNWFHMDSSDGYFGVASDKAYTKVLAGKSSTPVIVAVIDSGVDAEHEDLFANMWTNPGEIPGNGIDDDKNGYIDDVHGWNFIGGPNGNVNEDTYEVTRLYKKYKYKYEKANRSVLSKEEQKEYDMFKVYEADVTAELEKAQTRLIKIASQEEGLMNALDALELALGDQELNIDNVSALESDDQAVIMGKNIASNLLVENPEVTNVEMIRDVLKGELVGAKDYFQGKLDYAYNTEFDARKVVGDNYNDSSEKYYGNNDVEGPDALHGTHVAGIIGAVRNNGVGMDGVADNVLIMSVRTVPNGDERDKDVANAIRYAVDNGASIINMSFGKAYSWDKKVVDDAVKYAAKNDVLLVHAAGNSAQNNDTTNNFPNDGYDKSGLFAPKKSATWLEVGALNFAQGENFPAPFSNYGKANVDLFAPGMSIYSTVPNDEYQPLQGTSMASPVVAGVAAMIRSYYPSLSAKQVKELLMETVQPISVEVLIPGQDGATTNFSTLSVSGGTVNAYNASMKASTMKGKRKKKFQAAATAYKSRA